jgi:hypothetical protein
MLGYFPSAPYVAGSGSLLDDIRVNGLNHELGLADDGDDTWGDTTRRNFFLQRAFGKLWPEMGRSRRFPLSIVAGQSVYDLTAEGITLREIVAITLFDSTGAEVDSLPSWNLYVNEDDVDPQVQLTISSNVAAGYSVYLYGYSPYIVPPTGASACDLPTSLEFVVCAGARVEAYRSKLNEYANFPRLSNENRANGLSAAEIIELMRSAVSDFREAKSANAKASAAPRRAMRSTR